MRSYLLGVCIAFVRFAIFGNGLPIRLSCHTHPDTGVIRSRSGRRRSTPRVPSPFAILVARDVVALTHVFRARMPSLYVHTCCGRFQLWKRPRPIWLSTPYRRVKHCKHRLQYNPVLLQWVLMLMILQSRNPMPRLGLD